MGRLCSACFPNGSDSRWYLGAPRSILWSGSRHQELATSDRPPRPPARIAGDSATFIRGGDRGIAGAWLIRLDRGPLGPQMLLYFFFEGGIFQGVGPPQLVTDNPNDDPDALEYQVASGGEWVQTGFNEYALRAVSVDYDA